MDQADYMINDLLEEDTKRPDVDNIPLKEWDTLKKLHDAGNGRVIYQVWCFWDGCFLNATARCKEHKGADTEILSVDDIVITGRE